jgi:hypothetical protein
MSHPACQTAPMKTTNLFERLTNYTLNDGRILTSIRDDVEEDYLQSLKALIPSRGGRIPGQQKLHTQIIPFGPSAAVFTILFGKDPVAACAVAWDPEFAPFAWNQLEHLYLDLTDTMIPPVPGAPVAEMPSGLPWVAVVFFPLCPLASDVRSGITDVATSMAWALIDEGAAQARICDPVNRC